ERRGERLLDGGTRRLSRERRRGEQDEGERDQGPHAPLLTPVRRLLQSAPHEKDSQEGSLEKGRGEEGGGAEADGRRRDAPAPGIEGGVSDVYAGADPDHRPGAVQIPAAVS